METLGHKSKWDLFTFEMQLNLVPLLTKSSVASVARASFCTWLRLENAPPPSSILAAYSILLDYILNSANAHSQWSLFSRTNQMNSVLSEFRCKKIISFHEWLIKWTISCSSQQRWLDRGTEREDSSPTRIELIFIKVKLTLNLPGLFVDHELSALSIQWKNRSKNNECKL